MKPFKGGLFQGDFMLPSSLHQGDYYIRFYTFSGSDLYLFQGVMVILFPPDKNKIEVK